MKLFYSPRRTMVLLATLLCTIFLNIQQARASHGMGADLTYTCLGGNQYEITLQLYRDCAGIAAPATALINFSSASCGVTGQSVTLNQQSFSEASPLCAAQISQSTCNGGTLQGVEVYTYTGTVTLSQQCNDWIFSYRLGNRNAAITNISAPGSAWMYVETQLNNLDVTCNNSPTFTTPPVPYICDGVPFSYNHGVVDAEGDSLAFSLIDPLDNTGTPITWIAGFNANQPLTTTGAFGFDPATGQMTFTPNGTQNGVLAVEVREYRNGVLIGRSIRDMQIVVITCTNNVPTTTGLVGLTGASSSGNSIFTCEGNTVQFGITANDLDALDVISVTNTITTNLPGSTVNVVGSNPATINVTWTVPPNALSNYSFTVTFNDGACPIPGQQIVGYNVTLPTVTVPQSNFTKCPGQSTTQSLDATSNSPGSYSWSPGTGLSCTNCPNPTATLTTPTTYTVTFTDNATGCTATNSVSFQDQNSYIDVTPTSVNYCVGDPAAQLNAQLYVNGSPVSGGGSSCYSEAITIVNPALTTNNAFNFTGTPTGATGGGTLTIYAYGDLDGTGTNVEEWTIQDEGGLTIGTIGATGDFNDQCGTVLTITIPLTDAQINGWAASGSIDFTAIDLGGNVSPTLCGAGQDSVRMELDYCTNGGGSSGGPYTESLSLGGGSGGCYNNGITVMNPALTTNNNFNFAGTPTGATGGGTLTIYAYGDLDGTGTNIEEWTIQDEGGLTLGTIGATGDFNDQCGTVLTITIPLTDAQINGWAANGSIDFTAIDLGGNVSPTLCGVGEDSVRMELSYCTSGSGGDCSGTTLNYNHVMTFNNTAPDASTNVTLTFCIEGDYGTGGLEQIEIFGEGGVSLGLFDETTAGATYSDCGSPGFCNTVTIPMADWNNWNNDGQVVITGIPDADVNFSCSGNYSCLTSAQVDYTAAPTGSGLYSWSPPAGLSATNIANPLASPTSNTTYIVSASDGICTVTASIPVTCGTLPVTCSQLRTVWNEEQHGVDVHWQVSAEEYNAGFMIERATANGQFEELGWVASRGDVNQARNYTYFDQNALQGGQEYYYRIRQVDLDGTESYICELKHITIPGEGIANLSIRPNPTHSSVEIFLESEINGEIEIQVIDVLGRVVYQRNSVPLTLGQNTYQVDLSDFAAGVYYFKVGDDELGFHEVIRVVKQ